jgi:hypothetical protein
MRSRVGLGHCGEGVRDRAGPGGGREKALELLFSGNKVLSVKTKNEMKVDSFWVL